MAHPEQLPKEFPQRRNSARIARAIGAFLLLSFITLHSVGLAAQDSIGKQLALLKSPDPDVRIEALRAVETSVDPRLPDVMLALLTDDGNSIRRLAARGVGSRWWQIPKERIPVFLAALKRHEKSEFDDEVCMVQRGLGLLRRDYAGPMFARSPNHRWVIYERLKLPCLIDTTSGTEELLGWSKTEPDNFFDNIALDKFVFWHGKKEIAAMDMYQGRKGSAVWIWQHGAGLTKLDADEIAKAVGVRWKNINFSMGFETEIKGWKGDELQFEASFTSSNSRDDKQTDHKTVLGWNPARKGLRVISHDTVPGY